MTYQIWIFSKTDAKTAYLQNAFDIQRTDKVNQTPTLSFSLPADDAKAVYLTATYEVKIWNTRASTAGDWEGLYILDDAEETWDSSGTIITANYSGVMGQLVDEDNITYDTTSTRKTPTQIITALLALQENTARITIGTIEPGTSFAFAVENINLLAAFLKCTEYLGGYIDVNSDRELNWWSEPAGDPVREIRYMKNMKGVGRKTNFTTIINRVYTYGAEYPDESRLLNLTDAGEAEYIEDGTSQTAYGIRIRRITDKTISHPSTLLLWAQRVLAAYKDPVYSYQVDVVNLAEHTDFDFDFENLEVGQIVRVVNSDMNDLSVDVKVMSVITQLDRPEEIQIELANATKTIADSLGSVQSRISLSDNIAVQIGTGQVTIAGAVVISDWVSAGVTTINGGEITAGTVTADKLFASYIEVAGAAADINGNVTTISGGKITANTVDCVALKTSAIGNAVAITSSNYVADTSGFRIYGDGSSEFNNVKVRGTLYTTTINAGSVLTVSGNIQSANFVLGVAGWQMNGGGAVYCYTIDAVSNISTATVYGTTNIYTPLLKLQTTPINYIGEIYLSADGNSLYFKGQDGGVHQLA